jgi:hypothetical protein
MHHKVGNHSEKLPKNIQQAAAIFSALIRSESSGSYQLQKSNHQNTWTEQLYEE